MFLVGTALSTLVFAWAVDVQQQILRRDVDHRSVLLSSSLSRELEHSLGQFKAFTTLIGVAPNAPRAQLRALLTSFKATAPDGLALDWAPQIPGEERKAFEESQWLQGAPDFRVHRSQPLPEPQGYQLPLLFGVGAGTLAEDYDLTSGSDLTSIAPIQFGLEVARARRSAVAAATVKVRTLQGTGSAVVLVGPVFSAGPGESAQPLGYGLGLLDLESALRRAIPQDDRYDLTLELEDPSGASLVSHHAARGESEDLLVSLWALLGTAPPSQESVLVPEDFRWTLRVTAGPRLLAAHLSWMPWLVAAMGILLTVVSTTATGAHLTREAGLADIGGRLALERRESQEKLGALTDDLDREKLDRRRTEQNLFREKQQFRLMFNAVPAMIFYKDTKNRFLLVNEAAAASLGRTVEEVEGKPCSEILPAKAYELYRDDLEIIQNGKPKIGLTEELPLPNGTTIWVRTDKLPEYDSMGRVVGILVFSQDISEHRRAEEKVRKLTGELEGRVVARTAELRAANQELESFAYTVSHDLRTPLRIIDGFSKLVQEEHAAVLPASGQDYLGRLRAAAQLLGQQLEDLLQMTRLSRTEYRPAEVDLSLLARQVVAELRRSAPDRRVDLVVEATPFATGDKDLLARVLENLLGNAWKFTTGTPAPRIEFGSTTLPDQRTAFYVRDNGAGFDMVHAGRLFGPFQRLHKPEEFAGSGMGLAIVRLIVRRHGGEVWAQSEPDKGTTFFFTLGA